MEINSPSDHTQFSTSIFSFDSSGGSPESDGTLLVDKTVPVSSVKAYVEDQSNVDPDKLMPYMFMLGRGWMKVVLMKRIKNTSTQQSQIT
mmetsp:Transcript_9762/g.12361  ORF Transcript_9762/g.12361 Transcript_9762/m.12361 type:complete len:90 (-) Transcript_9762:525-794(-)